MTCNCMRERRECTRRGHRWWQGGEYDPLMI
jgi:hypothetical protein